MARNPNINVSSSSSGAIGHASSSPRLHIPASSTNGLMEGLQGLDIGQHTSPRPSLSPEDSFRHSSSRRPSSSRRRSNGTNEPHNVAEEAAPETPFHDPAFQRAFSDAKDLMKGLSATLGGSGLHTEPDSNMRSLHMRTVELSAYQTPSTRTVGLVGDSGVGKSSLLNSLMDNRALARTSNSGSACTCVVTEYHYHADTSFKVEVDYFSLSELRDQFTELLQGYRHFHLNREQIDVQDLPEVEAKANLARDTFQAAFGVDFTQNELRMTRDPEEQVMDLFLGWARDRAPIMDGVADEASGCNQVYTAATVEDCSSLLSSLTSVAAGERQPERWPFIHKIIVNCNAIILSKGLILVDLPGLRDLNSARVKITERYLLHCDEIFAVSAIGRVTTDEGVKAVFDLARRARLSQVGIICTKSDDIRAEEAERDWRGQTGRTTKRLREAVEQDMREIEDIDDDIQYADDEEQQAQLATELVRIRRRLKDHQFELWSHLINTRNRIVERKLRSMYVTANQTRLEVFCISNTLYWDHRTEARNESRRYLDLSGILEVRKHCISLVASNQFRATTTYLRDDIPALLGSIELWVQSGAGSLSEERRRAVRNVVGRVERVLQNHLTWPTSKFGAIAESMERGFQGRIGQPMSQRSARFREGAVNAAAEWQGWHHSSFSAFCRQYGYHSTPAAGAHCWNDEAMERFVAQMNGGWENLVLDVTTAGEDANDTIAQCFSEAINLLHRLQADTPDGGNPSIRTLAATLIHRRRLLQDYIEDLYGEFGRKFAIVQKNSLSGYRTSYMGICMEPSYRQANLQSGSGSDARRKRIIITEGFGNRELFPTIRKQTHKNFVTAARELESAVLDVIAAQLEIVQRDLDAVRNENVALEAERDPEFRERVRKMVESTRSEMERKVLGVVGGANGRERGE